MNKKLYWTLLIILSVLTICSVLGTFVFENVENCFAFSTVGFFMAGFMLWQYKNALVPLKKGGPINLSKGFWHRIGKPGGYKVHCIVWGVVMLLIAIGNTIKGIVLLF
ncbi:MAG: hypothetical protein IJZ33_02400 [Clostridia bacterium]|nr:hypothetical protein [Clostridia bacterium]